MRHYTKIPTEASKSGKELLAKAGVERADEGVLSEFVALAHRLGFASEEIQSLRQESSDWQIARNALLKARKPERYCYDEAILESHVAQIVDFFATATPRTHETSKPAFVSADPDAPGNRCGFPNKDAQEEDSEFLFLPHLHNEVDDLGQEVTSFFVRQSVYLAFFDKVPDLKMDNISDGSQPTSPASEQVTISTSRVSQTDRVELSRDQSSAMMDVEQNVTRVREQERLERERLEWEKVKLEREELKQERLRLEQERRKLEQERQEQERQAQERREQERREQERREQERREQERLKQERLEQKLPRQVTTCSSEDSEQDHNLSTQSNDQIHAKDTPEVDRDISELPEDGQPQIYRQRTSEQLSNLVTNNGGNITDNSHTSANKRPVGQQVRLALSNLIVAYFVGSERNCFVCTTSYSDYILYLGARWVEDRPHNRCRSFRHVRG